MDAQEFRERLLTGGRSLNAFVATACVLLGLVFVDMAFGFDRSDAFWFDEGDQVLYCRVVNDTEGRVPPMNILTGWLVVASPSLEATCRHHPPEHVGDEALTGASEASTRLGITRLEIHHDPETDPGCIEVRGGVAGRIRTHGCVEDAQP